MGTRWRRAFCTTIPRDKDSIEADDKQSNNTCQLKSSGKLRLFPSFSNPSTPRLNSTPVTTLPELKSADNTPRLQCKTSVKKSKSSNPSSPRSPFSIFKNTLRLSKNGCGVCLQSVKTRHGMAVYTAECSHSFHFPCISHHVRKQGNMVCPVCNLTWKDVPLLFPHTINQDDVVDKTVTSTQSEVSINNSQRFTDDESLATPVSGARFNPIPEAVEEDNEEEFKGFFVNPTPVNFDCLNKRRVQPNVEVKLLPESAVISAGRSQETYAVALRVKAPPPPLVSSSHRAPVDLITVLDVSDTMTGEKLQILKRTMRLVISSLGSSDRLSIVSFSSKPYRLLPLRRMTPQGHRLARRILDNLSVGEGKSVAAALRLAGKVLEDRKEKNPVASIILLSDGQDESSQNNSNQRNETSHVTSTRFGHIEIPVHSYGVEDAFVKRVGGLLSVVVQDLRLQLGFSSGDITAVYSTNGRPRLYNCDSVKLGDLYAEEERELLIELRVPTSTTRSHHVMSVRCSYWDPATGEVMYGKERALLIPRPHAVRSSYPRIQRLRNVFVATRAVAETRRLVEHYEFGSAQELLVSARELVAQSGSASTKEYVTWLDAELAELKWKRQYRVQQREQEIMVVQQQRRSRRLAGEKHSHSHVAFVDVNGEPLTPTSAWREAERLANVAIMKKSINKSPGLHGFGDARF